jgi:uncharacterized membrane protein YeaQ/YmgE (transglycosylase-associated protein family)
MERDLFFWILIGLVTGTVAKLVFPAREPGGFVLALLLGIAGALAGGFLALHLSRGLPSIDTSVLSAGAGAIVFLLLYRIVIRQRTR